MLTIKHRYTTYTVHSITSTSAYDRILAVAYATGRPNVPIAVLEVSSWHYGDRNKQPEVSISAIALFVSEAESIYNLTRKEESECV